MLVVCPEGFVNRRRVNSSHAHRSRYTVDPYLRPWFFVFYPFSLFCGDSLGFLIFFVYIYILNCEGAKHGGEYGEGLPPGSV